MSLTNITQIARSKGDPRVEHKGPSSLTGPDRLARALGWFSIGLGDRRAGRARPDRPDARPRRQGGSDPGLWRP